MKFYAGIGARATPEPTIKLMKVIGAQLTAEGYTLRSGAAKGADSAFEAGCNSLAGRKEIFRASDATPEAIAIAAQHHPNWGACNSYVQKLHGRNAMILLGNNLDKPVKFVCCWTPQSKIVGGTGLALRIAKTYDIQVRNLADPNVIKSVHSWLAKEQKTPQLSK